LGINPPLANQSVQAIDCELLARCPAEVQETHRRAHAERGCIESNLGIDTKLVMSPDESRTGQDRACQIVENDTRIGRADQWSREIVEEESCVGLARQSSIEAQ
jgi:hypothetical protein